MTSSSSAPLAPIDPALGKVAVVEGGQALQLTPAAGAVGPIMFPYTITDGRGGSDSATVTVTIHPDSENIPPTTVPDTAEVEAGRTVSVDVLANDSDPEGDLLALSAVDAPAGSAQFTAAGVVTFTAPPSPGPVVVTYTVLDERGAGAQGTLTVDVEPAGNLPPHAENDVATTVVGHQVTVDVLANDTDANGDTLTLVRVDQQPGVTLSFTAQGQVTASGSAVGSYQITYEVSDGALSDTGLLRLVVQAAGGQHPPVAVRDEIDLRPSTPTPLAVLANDVDPDGNVLVLQQVTPPTLPGFTVEVVGHRSLRLTTTVPLTSVVTFTYVVSNGYGTDTGTVLVRPLSSDGVNSPPVANPDELTVRAGATVAIPVLANDSDPDGDVLTLLSVTPVAAADGLLFTQGNELRFVAPSTERGGLTATYTVQDSAGNRSEGAVLIHVTPSDAATNHPPAPAQTTAAVFAGQQVTVDLPLQQSDPDGDVVQLVSLLDPPSLGQVLSLSGSQLVYRADATGAGTDRLTYEVQDQYGAQGIGTVLIGVVAAPGVNSPPVAINDQVTVKPGGSVTVDVLRNDSDPDGDVISLAGVGTPRVGTAVQKNQTVVFTAPAGGADEVSFDYSITDGRGGVASALVTVDVKADATQLAPQARDDVGPTSTTGATVDVDVLANDDDPSGDVSDLDVSVEGVPFASVVGTQVRVLMPDHAVQVLYTVTNPAGLTAKAVVSIPWRAPDSPVVTANPDEVSTPFNTPVTVDVLANDVGASLSVTGVVAAHGGAAQAVGATVAFAPQTGFVGDGGFSYTISDGHSSSVGTVLVHVASQSDRPPTFRPVTVSLPAGGTTTLDLARSAADPDTGDVLTFKGLSAAPAGVTASLTGSTLSLTAAATAAGASGPLTVTVDDGHGMSVEGTVTLTVLSSEKPIPVAVADTAKTEQGQSVTIPVLSNDVDPLGKGLTVTGVGSAGGGATTSTPTGVTFTPQAAFSGETTFTYEITDASGDPARTAAGSVTVTVVGRPGAPSAVTAQTPAQSGRATLTWKAAAPNGGPVDHYTVTTAPATQATTCPGTTCTVPGLQNGTAYAFTVVATNEAGDGPGAVLGSYTPDQLPGKTAAPNAQPGDNQVTVTWAAGDDGGSPLTGFTVSVVGGASMTLPASATQASFTGLTNGQSYAFTVTQTNAAGSGSPSDPSGGAVPAGPPLTPSAPQTQTGDKQVTLTITPPDDNGSPITEYVVMATGAGETTTYTFDASTLTRTITGLSNGVSYTFDVMAENGKGPSPRSAESPPVMAEGVPGRPTVSATAGDQKATLTVGDVDGNGESVDHFLVKINAGSPQTLPSDDVVTGLTNGSSYQFEVATCSATGCGDYSSPSTAVVPNGQPTITSLGCTSSGTTVTFSWTGNPNGRVLDHYELAIYTGSGPGSYMPIGKVTSYQVQATDHQYEQYDVALVATDGSDSGTYTDACYDDGPPPYTPTGPPTVTVSKDTSRAAPPECGTNTCGYYAIEMTAFKPSATYTVYCESDTGPFQQFVVTTTTYGNDLAVGECDYEGGAGHVWALVSGPDPGNGATSTHVATP